MSTILKKTKSNSSMDINELNKNEEDLLSFSSKYKATMPKEEDFQENKIENKIKDRKISCDSTSISFSQEYSNLSVNSKKLNNSIKEKILNNNTEPNEVMKKNKETQRKWSSPICCYYDGWDIYLSKKHKKFIDLKKSQNFIKKESFFSEPFKYTKNFNDNECNNNLNLNFNSICPNDNYIQNNNCQQKVYTSNKRLSFNAPQDINYNSILQQNFNNNNMLYLNNIYQQQLINSVYMNLNNFENNSIRGNRKLSYNFEGRIIDNYFRNILNLNNTCQAAVGNYNQNLFSYNEDAGKNNNNKNLSNKSINNSKGQANKKHFDKRKGDWLCPECNNLNFAFRIVCNRCHLPKQNDDDNNSCNIINNDK